MLLGYINVFEYAQAQGGFHFQPGLMHRSREDADAHAERTAIPRIACVPVHHGQGLGPEPDVARLIQARHEDTVVLFSETQHS